MSTVNEMPLVGYTMGAYSNVLDAVEKKGIGVKQDSKEIWVIMGNLLSAIRTDKIDDMKYYEILSNYIVACSRKKLNRQPSRTIRIIKKVNKTDRVNGIKTIITEKTVTCEPSRLRYNGIMDDIKQDTLLMILDNKDSLKTLVNKVYYKMFKYCQAHTDSIDTETGEEIINQLSKESFENDSSQINNEMYDKKIKTSRYKFDQAVENYCKKYGLVSRDRVKNEIKHFCIID